MKSKLAIAVTLWGWLLFVVWLAHDYIIFEDNFFQHMFQTEHGYELTASHIVFLLIPFIYTFLGYLINEREKLLNRIKESEARYRELSLTDGLTSLYNRRGFHFLSEQQVKVVSRTKQKLLLLFIDVDDVKWINDNLGHQEGDRALIDTANILRRLIRKSDILARLGGDEFIALVVETTENLVHILTQRLEESCRRYNGEEIRPFRLSLSVGYAQYDPLSPCSVEELLDRADKNMYEKRQIKRNSKDYKKTPATTQ